MKILGSNVLILKEKKEYSGVIQGVESDDASYAKVLGIGEHVTKVAIKETILLDWNKSKKVKNDLYVILEEDIIAIIDPEDLEL